ncbi:MAG: hypothetical protein R3D58_05420 [Saprospiraceae bacterium]
MKTAANFEKPDEVGLLKKFILTRISLAIFQGIGVLSDSSCFPADFNIPAQLLRFEKTNIAQFFHQTQTGYYVRIK